MSTHFAAGPDAPFIAARRVEHDGDRSVVAAGSLIGRLLHVKGTLEDADSLAGAILAGRLARERAEAAARETAS